jgi:hypothetical protein
MLNALLATLLVFASAGLLLYLIGLLFNAVRVAAGGGSISLDPGATWEQWRVHRCVARARRGDALREQGDLDGALREFQAAFVLHTLRTRALGSLVVNHHAGLLSRLIAVTEEAQGGTVRLLSLAKVDRLLNERSDIQRRAFASRHAGDRARVRELEAQLVQNRDELRAALRHLIGEIHTARRPVAMH